MINHAAALRTPRNCLKWTSYMPANCKDCVAVVDLTEEYDSIHYSDDGVGSQYSSDGVYCCSETFVTQ